MPSPAEQDIVRKPKRVQHPAKSFRLIYAAYTHRMSKLSAWLAENRQWVFSGLGITVLSAAVWLIRRALSPSLKAPQYPVTTQSNTQTVNLTVGANSSGPPSAKSIREQAQELLIDVQDRSKALASTVARALAIARATGNSDFEQFCQGELVGWSDLRKAGVRPAHRYVQEYASLSQLNLKYGGWAGDSRLILQEIESDPKRFAPVKVFWDSPLAEIEHMYSIDSSKSIVHYTMAWPEGPSVFGDTGVGSSVFMYASASTPAWIVDNVRSQLTKFLLTSVAP